MNLLGGMGAQVATSATAANGGSNNDLFGKIAVKSAADHAKVETVTSDAPSEVSYCRMNAHMM